MDNKCFHIKGGVLIYDYLHFAIAFIKDLLIWQVIGFKIGFNLFKGFVCGVAFFGFITVGK